MFLLWFAGFVHQKVMAILLLFDGLTLFDAFSNKHGISPYLSSSPLITVKLSNILYISL